MSGSTPLGEPPTHLLLAIPLFLFTQHLLLEWHHEAESL